MYDFGIMESALLVGHANTTSKCKQDTSYTTYWTSTRRISMLNALLAISSDMEWVKSTLYGLFRNTDMKSFSQLSRELHGLLEERD